MVNNIPRAVHSLTRWVRSATSRNHHRDAALRWCPSDTSSKPSWPFFVASTVLLELLVIGDRWLSSTFDFICDLSSSLGRLIPEIKIHLFFMTQQGHLPICNNNLLRRYVGYPMRGWDLSIIISVLNDRYWMIHML